jgi:hypothetical protein
MLASLKLSSLSAQVPSYTESFLKVFMWQKVGEVDDCLNYRYLSYVDLRRGI